MNLRLHKEDCRAIDLLLDQSAAAAGKSATQSAFVSPEGVLRQRLVINMKVLGLLDNMLVTDPPRHLLNRTLRLVQEASGRDVTIHGHLAPTFSAQPPVA